MFDSSGAFTGSFGGKGAGPGEFSQANGLSWSARTTIWVVDMGNGRYSEFSRDGQFLGSHQAQFSHREPVSVFAVGEGLIYDEWLARSAAGITLSARRLNLLTGLSDMLVLTDSIGTPAYRTRRGTYTVPFGWRFVWRPTDSGAAWFARTDEYAIHRRVFGSDTSLTIMTDLSPFPVTDADRSDAIAVIERMKQRFGDRDRFDYSRIPRKKPLIGNLDIDSRGRVWVRRVTKDTSVWLDVFGVDGRHVMSVQTPWFASPWHPVRVMGEFVACVVTDSLGVNYVVRGRLQRRPR